MSRRRSEAKVLVMPGHLPAAPAACVKATTVSAVIRRSFRIGLVAGLLGGQPSRCRRCSADQRSEPARSRTARSPGPAHADDRRSPRRPERPAPIPDPRVPAAATAATRRGGRSPPEAACPTTHPVKAKVSSKIFHLPGMANYERTNPDRCYVDAAAAEADGPRRAAKR